jgi:hypothetical protein
MIKIAMCVFISSILSTFNVYLYALDGDPINLAAGVFCGFMVFLQIACFTKF